MCSGGANGNSKAVNADGLLDAEKRLRAAYVKRDTAEMTLQRERIEYLEEMALRLISEPSDAPDETPRSSV